MAESRRKLIIEAIVDDRRAIGRLGQLDQKMRGVGRTAGTASKNVGGLGLSLGGVAKATAGVFGVVSAVQALSSAARFAASAAIGMNASIETATLQFKTLTGDAASAEAKVKSLFNFAKRTPFESGPIIEASRLMQTFGGDALNTEANLRMIGDAAAAVSQPINELGMWVGRLFAALEGGQPIGEATLRLMEMGAITPQVVQKMRDMRDAGQSGAEVFTFFQGEMGRFTGAMEEQSQTWAGVTSTFWENVKLFIAERSTGAFEGLKGAIIAANKAFDQINKGPIDRAKDQINRLTRAQELNVEAINREIRVYGEANFQTLQRAQRTQDLINEIINQQTAEQAAITTTEAATAAAGALAEQEASVAQRAAEAAEAIQQFREEVDTATQVTFAWLDGALIPLDMRLEDARVSGGRLRNVIREMHENADNLESTSFANLNITVPEVKQNFEDLRGEIDPPNGFFGSVLESAKAMKTGLTGDKGLPGFFNKLGSGIVDGFGQIISGGITGLINQVLDWAVQALGKFFGWLGGKIASFFARPDPIQGTSPFGPPGSFGDNGPETPFVSPSPTGEPQPFGFGTFQQGGLVHGPGITDSVPALLAPGEFVMSRPAVQRFGAGGLAAMNSGAGMPGITVNITGGFFFDSPSSRRRFSSWVAQDLMRQLSQQRVIGGRV